MPPLYQDPLAAVARTEWRWLDVARALLDVSCEGWALALIALALYSFLERDVRDVLKAFLPLAAALAAAGALAFFSRAVGGLPRPVEGAGRGLAPLLVRAFPSGQAAAVAAFVSYTAFAYGRRMLPAVLAAAALGVACALGGPHPAAVLLAGGAAGAALGTSAFLVTVRLLPAGHLAALRALRRSPGARRQGTEDAGSA